MVTLCATWPGITVPRVGQSSSVWYSSTRQKSWDETRLDISGKRILNKQHCKVRAYRGHGRGNNLGQIWQ
jgi:hypothetical protein